MSRDVTREDLRTIVARGLSQTAGNYKLLIDLFNMDSQDYKRFLNFLRKHHCHLPFQQFRSVGSAGWTPAPTIGQAPRTGLAETEKRIPVSA
jgi:hypothetical protein